MDAADVDTYLVEAYLPRTSPGGAAAVAARARGVAATMRRDGTTIRFVHSFFVPEDELWFCFYEARSVDVVAEAARRAELALGRIQPILDDLCRSDFERPSNDDDYLERS